MPLLASVLMTAAVTLVAGSALAAPRGGSTAGVTGAPTRELPALESRETSVPREGSALVARARAWSLEEILEALRRVETGGEKDGGRHSTGDSGGAIGPFQIHRAYWIDTRLPGRWEDCRDPRYARAVVLAYWRRYCSKALEARDAETLVRIHNGGPDGAREAETLRFWRKVEHALQGLAVERAKALEADSKPRGVDAKAREAGARKRDLAPDARKRELAPDARTRDLAPDARMRELAPDARTRDLAPDARTRDDAPLGAPNSGAKRGEAKPAPASAPKPPPKPAPKPPAKGEDWV
ncbi:MAG: hypothetical protein IPJ77_18725 [Planctomycetes bacterium]|nr:hypothetical protein [Planctomycetota bacterium]